jgi:Ca2+-binding RTX toxin-like protein
MGLQGGLGTGSPYRASPFPFLETSLDGGAGNDLLTGGPNRETFYGGTGNDTLRGGGGNDLMYGNAGADRLEGGADGDGLYPGTGNDVILGGAGGDSFGAEGGLDGADDFRGGAGSDSVSYVSRSAAVRVDFDGVADDGLPGEHDNIRPDVENASGGAGADRLIGNGFANTFRGNAGADFLDGRGGDDPDQVNGGADNDVLEGGDGGDVLNGGADDDQLDDGLGSDILNGGTGNDLFDQGTGTNGPDVISGGAGGLDQVFYSSRSAGVSVSLDNTANDGIGVR